MYLKTPRLIQEHRLKQGLTQEALADAIGVSVQSISQWERGASMPPATRADRLARALKVPVATMKKTIIEDIAEIARIKAHLKYGVNYEPPETRR